MKRVNIDRGWQFSEKGLSSFVPMLLAGTKEVNLPHDFTIGTDVTPDTPWGSQVGFYKGGIGTYTKYLDISNEFENRRIVLEIDGAYRNAEITLNGNLVTQQPNGYMPFHADLTPYIKYGAKNRLTISVNNSAPYDGRWYTGSGIYRHVDLLDSPQVCLAPWSIFFHTQRIDPDGTAYAIAEITVENHTAQPVTKHVGFSIEKNGIVAATGSSPVTIPPLGITAARIPLVIESALLWDLDNPNLYTAKAVLCNGDTDETTVGIRTITIDTKHGLRLNGMPLKIKGGCVHHSNGILGAVSLYDAEYRKFKIMKDNGFNAVRCAHNVPSRDMLDACDRLGLLVMNEAFDNWRMRDGSLASDYHLFFESNWQADLERMITRDRSRACVFMWSIGNEIQERNGLSRGAEWSNRIAAYARSLDPTRPITSAICAPFSGLDDDDMNLMMQSLAEKAKNPRKPGSVQNLSSAWSDSVWAEKTAPFAAPLDVVGYNYLEHYYECDSKNLPNRIILGEESYPRQIDVVWELVEKLPNVIGDFTWTAVDYIGEAGLGQVAYMEEDEAAKISLFQGAPVNFPWRTAFCGDFDLCGFRRPQSHYRSIVWGSDETYMLAHNPVNFNKTEVMGRWAWSEAYEFWQFPGLEGKSTKVDVYSRADEVELLFNGESIGRKPAGKANRFHTQFELCYQPGTLTAISYTNGKKVSQISYETAGTVAKIRLTAEKQKLTSDGNELSYVIVELVDEQGCVVPFDDKLLKASVSGEGTLIAFGTGRPVTAENYTAGEFTSWLGKCVAVIRAGDVKGKAVLRVACDGLKTAEANILLI